MALKENDPLAPYDNQSAAKSAPVAESEDQMTAQQRGQYLAARFKDEGIHPILIFGAVASGKTSLLASLFQYIHHATTSNAILTLELDTIPTDTKAWQDMRRYATTLFERKVYEFMTQKAAPATLDELPFFIPVILRPNDKSERKFAFLEGRGEWYTSDVTADSLHQPFQGEVEGLLRNFNEPLTVIYVAPFTTWGYRGDGDKESAQSKEIKLRDISLLGVISQYQKMRIANFHTDNHIFLFTKWDIRCSGIGDKQLLRPDEELLTKTIALRYPLSYARFNNMSSGDVPSQKAVTHYCAGVIDGNAVMKPAEEDQQRLDFFPRKLWNWFYFNTTKTPLYDDVHPRPLNWVGRVIKALRGG